MRMIRATPKRVDRGPEKEFGFEIDLSCRVRGNSRRWGCKYSLCIVDISLLSDRESDVGS